MTVLNINLLGKLRAQVVEQELTGLEARKVQELFCYLLLYRDRPHCRETLAGVLWGDQTSVQSKKYLRQALWQLQTALAAHNDNNASVLLVEADWIRVNPRASIQLDVAILEQRHEAFKDLAGQELDFHAFHLLEQAVSLYQGDLLEDCYEDWCLFERERFQNIYLAVLDKLMDYCEARRQYETGLAYGQRLLRCDIARERTHRRLMRLHYLAGDRTAALRQYQRCQAVLASELGVRPSQQTVKLHQEIQAESPLAAASCVPAGSGCDDLSLPSLLLHLRQLEAALSQVQCHLQESLQDAERAMRDGHPIPLLHRSHQDD